MEAVGSDDRFILEIAGKVFPDEKQRFEELLAKHDNITFKGFVGGDEKREMLKSSAVKILPTLYPTEAQPISVIEALCLGCMIVSTEHIGIMDTLGENYPKDLYVKQDVEDIKRVLNDIYNDPSKHSEYMLEKSRKIIKKSSPKIIMQTIFMIH